jgi:hypothetical protein
MRIKINLIMLWIKKHQTHVKAIKTSNIFYFALASSKTLL